MAKGTNNIFSIVDKIKSGSKEAESYNTGLVGEKLIVSSYKTMDLDKLIKMRYIINQIIKVKKEELMKKVGLDEYKRKMNTFKFK